MFIRSHKSTAYTSVTAWHFTIHPFLAFFLVKPSLLYEFSEFIPILIYLWSRLK